MEYKELIKNNFKFITAMTLVITLGIIGITFALNYNASVDISIGTSQLGANITYLNGSSADITSTNSLIPINDATESITSSTTNSSLLKIDFKVSGVSTNPNNTIMDISLNNVTMDCELKSTYFKWKLYKNGELLNNGNFSPSFDIISNNRIVLTNTQENLTTTEDTYSLIIYIGESCTGDISDCDSSYDQKKLSNKNFTATMKLELSTGKKKTITRETSNTEACTYTSISVPICKTLTYNGASQTLVNTGTGYSLVNNTGKNAGKYATIAKLNDGYIWSGNTKGDKVIECNIAKKELTITAKDQTINSGSTLSSTISNITTTGLVTGDTVSSIYLYTPQYETGTGLIYARGAKIIDSSSNDVTNNYEINYISGTVTIE